jgi:hypothetical protein
MENIIDRYLVRVDGKTVFGTLNTGTRAEKRARAHHDSLVKAGVKGVKLLPIPRHR